jgi:predicted porin
LDWATATLSPEPQPRGRHLRAHPWEREDIIGLVAGHQIASGLELDVEAYDDHVHGAAHVTTLDVGGRYKLHRGFNLLFMAGRSAIGNSQGQVEFMGYLGIQILLSDYGRRLSEDP